MSQFKIGDVVQLKSGGPAMTVDSIGEDKAKRPFVNCLWFVGTKQESGTFSQDALQRHEKEKPRFAPEIHVVTHRVG